jgi:hypothetical protein
MELVPAFQQRIFAAVREAARGARAGQRPARTAAAHGTSDVTVNRRLQTNGRTIVAQNWDGERDTTMTIIRLDDVDEKPIATIVGYGTHPIVLAHQNRLLSPDYPGTVKRTVEEIVGGMCLFLQGCAGDQIPREALTGDVGAARRMGKLIGLDAARLALGMQTRPTTRRLERIVESGAPLGLWVEDALPDRPIPLAVASRKVSLPVRDYGPPDALAAESERRAAAVRRLDKETASEAEIATANYQAKRAAMNAKWGRICAGNTSREVEIQALRIGDAALVGVPLEPFSRIGAEIRAGSKLPVTQFAGYTNGWEGYVPTDDEFAKGGYETEWATPYGKGAAGVLVAEARRIIAEIA